MANFVQPIKPQSKDVVSVPAVIYGTAQKHDASIVVSVLGSGARGLDTACQPKNYNETVVGDALRIAFKAIPEGGLGLVRDDIYIQSKFTTRTGHTPETMPYAPEDPIPTMVNKSIQITLSKLRIRCIDTLLLHAPMETIAETLEVWRAMEGLMGNQTRALGICNVSCSTLETLYREVDVKPLVVQNRFWDGSGYDKDLIMFCEERGIIYQAFGVIRDNPRLLSSSLIGWLSEKLEVSVEDTLFLSVLSVLPGPGISALTGTTRPERVLSLLKTVERMERLPPPIREAFISLLYGEK